MAYSVDVARVLGDPDGILAGLSGARAAIKLVGRGHELSDQTLIQAKGGVFGRDGRTLRVIARGFYPELVEQFGDEIEEATGGREPEHAEAWLVNLGFPKEKSAPPQKAGSLDVRQLASAVADELSPLIRAQIEEIMKQRQPDEGVAVYFWRRIAELNETYGTAAPVFFQGGEPVLTEENVDRYLAAIERQMQKRGDLKKD